MKFSRSVRQTALCIVWNLGPSVIMPRWARLSLTCHLSRELIIAVHREAVRNCSSPWRIAGRRKTLTWKSGGRQRKLSVNDLLQTRTPFSRWKLFSRYSEEWIIHSLPQGVCRDRACSSHRRIYGDLRNTRKSLQLVLFSSLFSQVCKACNCLLRHLIVILDLLKSMYAFQVVHFDILKITFWLLMTFISYWLIDVLKCYFTKALPLILCKKIAQFTYTATLDYPGSSLSSRACLRIMGRGDAYSG